MKEKRYEELEGIIHSLRNHKKIKDFSSALASFEELQKAYTKAGAIIAKVFNNLFIFCNFCWFYYSIYRLQN